MNHFLELSCHHITDTLPGMILMGLLFAPASFVNQEAREFAGLNNWSFWRECRPPNNCSGKTRWPSISKLQHLQQVPRLKLDWVDQLFYMQSSVVYTNPQGKTKDSTRECRAFFCKQFQTTCKYTGQENAKKLSGSNLKLHASKQYSVMQWNFTVLNLLSVDDG